MGLLEQARRLESRIARRFDRAAHQAVGTVDVEPLEIVHQIVEAVEREIQPGGRGTRVFPFNSIALSLLASREERPRFDAVVAGHLTLRDRIVERLRSKSCRIDDLTLDVAYLGRANKEWRHPRFHLVFARVEQPRIVETRPAASLAGLDLTIVHGTAEQDTYSFAVKRIDLGRGTEVRDTGNRLIRTNHVAFVEGAGAVNQSVSRRHAHIAYDPRSGSYRVRDEGSVHGTSLVRNGSTVAVPPGSLGVRLQTGDEIVLGNARLRVRFDRDNGPTQSVR